MNWYKELAENHNIVGYNASIGKSVEGRDLPSVHIGTTGGLQIYFQCQIHASKCIQIILSSVILRPRYHKFKLMCAPTVYKVYIMFSISSTGPSFLGEWISGATCMYIANYLAESKDEEVRLHTHTSIHVLHSSHYFHCIHIGDRPIEVVRFHTHAYIVHSSHYFHCIHIGDRPIEECAVYICANREPGWICGTVVQTRIFVMAFIMSWFYNSWGRASFPHFTR